MTKINEINAAEIRDIVTMLEELPYSDYITKTSKVDIRRPLKFLGKLEIGGVYNCHGFAPAWLVAEKYRKLLRENGFVEPKAPVFDHYDFARTIDQYSIYADMIFA